MFLWLQPLLKWTDFGSVMFLPLRKLMCVWRVSGYLCVSVEGWFQAIYWKSSPSPVCVNWRARKMQHFPVCVNIVSISCFSASFPVTEKMNTYAFPVLQGEHLSVQPWQSPSCVSNEPHERLVWKSAFHMCVSVFVCTCKPKPIRLFPLRSAWLRCGDTSVALGSGRCWC